MNNNKKSINLQLFAEGEQTGADTQPDTQPQVDYEQEYKKQAIELERLKNAISKTNSENAEYKRRELEAKEKEIAKLSDEEKRAKEFDDLKKSNEELQTQLKQIQTEKEFLGCGFTKEEFESMTEKGFTIAAWGELFKAKLEENTKSVTANLIKGTTSKENMGDGTANSSKTKSGFASFQEKESKRTANGKVEL